MSATSGSLNPQAIQPVSSMVPFGAWMTVGFAGIAVLPGLVATTYWQPARSGMEGWALIALAGQESRAGQHVVLALKAVYVCLIPEIEGQLFDPWNIRGRRRADGELRGGRARPGGDHLQPCMLQADVLP